MYGQVNSGVYKKLYWIVVLLSLVLYCALLGGQYVWADEAYTFAMIRHSYSEIWSITAADVHPPLYYWILKFLIQPFHYGLMAAKIVSILPFLLIIAFGGVQFKKLFGEKEALGFMVLFFLFPFSMPYAVEVRMYSWAALFVFGNAVFAYRCYMDSRAGDWYYFAFFGVCSAYTHYFSLVSTGIVYALLLLAICIGKKEKLRQWLIFSVLTAVLYLPWMKSFIEQLIYKANNEYWIGPITLRTVLTYAYSIFGGFGSVIFTVLVAVAYLTVFLFLLMRCREKQAVAPMAAFCALAVPVGTLVVGVLASILVRPVFVIRYLIPSAPLLIAFFVLALRNVSCSQLCVFAVSVALIVGLLGYEKLFRSEYKQTENALDRRFVELCETVDSYVACTESTHIQNVLSYYDAEKPIYGTYSQNWAAIPYANLLPTSKFSYGENDSIALLLDIGELPGAEYSVYQSEYLGQFDECGNLFDAFLLTKK